MNVQLHYFHLTTLNTKQKKNIVTSKLPGVEVLVVEVLVEVEVEVEVLVEVEVVVVVGARRPFESLNTLASAAA